MSGRTETVGAYFARTHGLPKDRVVGSRDVAALLGVSRQRVGQLARDDPTFPRPVTQGSGGPIWYRAGVEVWAAGHRKVPPAAGRMHPRAGQLLAIAERLSRELRHGYVSRDHFWGALSDPGAGSPVASVLESLGVDRDEIRRAHLFHTPAGEGQRRLVRMNPAVQQQLEIAHRRAADAGRAAVTDFDIALAWLDADDAEPRRDAVLYYLGRRGVDKAELRRRVEAIEADESAAESFDFRALPKRPPRRRKPLRPKWLPPLKANPLGRDPWERHPWSSSFAFRKDERLSKVDGAQWFFYIDADGYFIRTEDGRPVGYRWSIVTKGGKIAGPADAGDPSLRAVRHPPRGRLMEVLPPPPADVAYWPDYRYVRDD
jgi:predicted DNA-binding transcriptional regulator AlpA